MFIFQDDFRRSICGPPNTHFSIKTHFKSKETCFHFNIFLSNGKVLHATKEHLFLSFPRLWGSSKYTRAWYVLLKIQAACAAWKESDPCCSCWRPCRNDPCKPFSICLNIPLARTIAALTDSGRWLTPGSPSQASFVYPWGWCTHYQSSFSPFFCHSEHHTGRWALDLILADTVI